MFYCGFKHSLDLNINLNKSELVRIGDKRDEVQLAKVMGCKAGSLPIKYLGAPFGAKYKDPRTWEPVVELVEKRLVSWKMKFLSKGGRLTLI